MKTPKRKRQAARSQKTGQRSWKTPEFGASLAVHSLFVLFLLFWFRSYLSDAWVASVDLPGHVTVIDRLSTQLLSGRLRFFDPEWFSGWPAFSFYAPLSHLLAALLSLPLALFSDSPAQLSAHLLLLCSLISIAPLFHFFTTTLLRTYSSEGGETFRWHSAVFAILSCSFAFWFINHDRQWYGIGAAAALHVGLFSQAIAWPLLLWFFRQLASVCYCTTQGDRAGCKRNALGLTLAFAALFLTHSLTAAFGLFATLVFLALHRDARPVLMRQMGIAFLLSGFWFVPFLAFSPAYTGLDIYRPEGDFLEILFRYPLVGLKESLLSLFDGKIADINLTNVLILGLAIGAFFWSRVHTSKVFCSFGIVVLLGLVVFSSGYVASSIPVGLHYYRFYAYVFLLVTALLAVLPALALYSSSRPALVSALLVLISLGSIVNTAVLPHYEKQRIAGLRGEEQFRNEKQVLAYLRREPDVGRVFFGYFDNYKTYPFLSAHFMTSQLGRRNEQETLNGLFIQSSLAYRMPVASAVLLGIRSYHIPLLFTDDAELSPRVALQQLRDAGVTHIVMGKHEVREALARMVIGRIHYVGPYAIVRIAKTKAPLVQAVEKPIIAYANIAGSLAFRYFEMYFYSKAALYTKFELLEIKEGDSLPPGVSAIVLNGMLSDESLRSWLGSSPKELPNVIRLAFNEHYTLRHYSVWYQHNVELDAYKHIVKTFDKDLSLVGRLLSIPRRAREFAGEPPSIAISSDGQSLSLSSLTPGQLYKVRYSYFPYWAADSARIYRGMPERLFVLADAKDVELHYSLFSKRSTWLGYLLSSIGVLLVFVQYRTIRRNTK